jgi:hypothetical protein
MLNKLSIFWSTDKKMDFCLINGFAINWNQLAIVIQKESTWEIFDSEGIGEEILFEFLCLFFVLFFGLIRANDFTAFLCDHKKFSVTNVSKSLLSFSQLSFPMQPLLVQRKINIFLKN